LRGGVAGKAKKFHAFLPRIRAAGTGDYAILGLAAQAIVEGDGLPIFAWHSRVGDRPVLAKAASSSSA